MKQQTNGHVEKKILESRITNHSCTGALHGVINHWSTWKRHVLCKSVAL